MSAPFKVETPLVAALMRLSGDIMRFIATLRNVLTMAAWAALFLTAFAAVIVVAAGGRG